MNVNYPFQFDWYGKTRKADDNKHAQDMLIQLLFTAPGERVNRPDFGCGLEQLVFAPNSPELAATLQTIAMAAVLRELGDLIELRDLKASAKDSVLSVEVCYVVLQTGATEQETFKRRIG